MRKQIALCIGQNNYCDSFLEPLECAVNDAEKIAEKLKLLHYDVYLYKDLKYDEFYDAVDGFIKLLPNYEVALFFYAGHGFENEGHNLLMPIDIADGDGKYLVRHSFDLDYLIQEIEGKSTKNNLKTKIIILDACRAKFEGRGNSCKGFAPICAPQGTIIAFSTSPGQLAHENKKFNHGYYSEALLNQIDLPRIPIENMFKHVRENLSAVLNGKQIPWEHTSLMGNYYFNEDTIEQFIPYISDALKDSYYIAQDSLIKKIINDLKSHDWNIQNPAISNIVKVNFAKVSTNDLFVLGRNIYQTACGGSFSAQSFIKSFDSNIYIPEMARQHILNGMAYEIYYDKNGNLRGNFKTNMCFDIISLLEKESYQLCRNFISNSLQNQNDYLVYIPGSEERFIFDILYGKVEINCDNYIPIIKVFYKGRNIFVDKDNNEFDEGNCEKLIKDEEELHGLLSEKIVAPYDMIKINLNKPLIKNSKYLIPFNFKLIK